MHGRIKRSSRWPRGIRVTLFALLLAGCTKSTQHDPPLPRSPEPPAPHPAATPASPASESEWLPLSPPPPPAGAPVSPGTSSIQPYGDLEGARSFEFQARLDDFLVAQLALIRAANACDDACRALRSMSRAADRLCAMAASDDELERCERARDIVAEARVRVRQTCQSCPGGPDLEKD